MTIIETLLACVLLLLVLGGGYECIATAMHLDKRDYDYTLAHTTCQATLEFAINQGLHAGQFQQIYSSYPQYFYADGLPGTAPQQHPLADDHRAVTGRTTTGAANPHAYVLEQDVTDIEAANGGGLLKVSVTIYEADPTSSVAAPAPRKPPIEQLSTLISRP